MKQTLLLLFLSCGLMAQNPTLHKCGYDLMKQSAEQSNPGHHNAYLKLFNHCKSSYHNSTKQSQIVYTIPVVFHVVYNSNNQNLSDAVLQSQLDVLNRDYRKQNENIADLREEFVPFAADTYIQFELAQFDENGNPTTGITRTETPNADFAPDILDFINPLANTNKVKSTAEGGQDAWDTDKYLNIWICNTGGAVLGFAYPPAQAPNWPSGQSASSPDLEGVVLHYQIVGDNNPENGAYFGIADEGRTAVHEVGHYLGLRHIWGDAIEFLGQDGCAEDDGIDDTPDMATNSQQQSSVPCDNLLNKNTCTDSPIDYPDMFENYMDYSMEKCQSLFTNEQAGIMREMLEIARPELWNNLPCSVDNITPSDINIFIGQPVTFTADFVNVDNILWFLGNAGFGSETEATHTYTETGNFQIMLVGSNAVSADTAYYQIYVQTTVDIEEISKQININSANGFINIDNQSTENLALNLYDVNGRILKSSQINKDQNRIDIQNFANGIYIVSLSNGNQIVKTQTIFK